MLSERSLAAMLRTLVRSAVTEAVAKARTPGLLSGTVEDLDEDLDVVFVRMDQETMGGDPAESDNYGSPGVIPATRLGETFTDEQVRVQFDGPAGASAMRTSIENRVVLPFGKETGQRIVLDGNTGSIVFYNDADDIVGFLDASQWAIGDVGPTPGARATLDPIGGLRLRSVDDILVAILDQQGYSLRSAATGIVTAEITPGTFRLVDPTGVDDIEMVTTTAGTLPNPAYRSAVEVNPGTTLVVPAAPTFTTPVDDIEIGHVAAWLRATNQSATMTPPTSWTEQHDGNFAQAAGTLQTSVATRDPAVGAAGTFTSTQSNWQHAVGTHVVIKGGGATSPSFRALSTTTQLTVASQTTIDVAKPTGTADTDVLLAFISLGVSGGLVPTGWTTPEGFVFLGAAYSTSGTGTSQSTLATGVWAKRAGASEPTTYFTTINLPTGTKMIHATMVAVQAPFLVPGGVQIRMAGRPIRRLLAFTELTSASTTLCDFTSIPQSYDNLELVYDASATNASGTPRILMQFNGDTTAGNYFSQVTSDGAITEEFGSAARIQLGALGPNTSATAGSINIYGYARLVSRHVVLGHAFWAPSLAIRDDSIVGQWGSGTAAINRVNVFTGGTTQFAIGSRAYLYGY